MGSQMGGSLDKWLPKGFKTEVAQSCKTAALMAKKLVIFKLLKKYDTSRQRGQVIKNDVYTASRDLF